MLCFQKVNLPRVLVAGTMGTALSGLFLAALAPRLSLGKLDYPHLLGSWIWGWAGFGFPRGTRMNLAGGILFLLGGMACAFPYASYVSERLPLREWLPGLLYGGLGVFLLTSLLFFPLRGELHPLVHAGQIPAPRLCGWGLSGSRVVLADFLGHCLLGVVLGFLYRRRLVFSQCAGGGSLP